jgi:nicotinamidase-related amidase
MQMSQSLEIDKSKTALVVIDLQKGISSFLVVPHDSKTVISNAAKLADAFRANKMPVFLVHVVSSDAERLKPIADEAMMFRGGPPSKDWADFVPEIGPKEGDLIITKKQWGAFYGTDLELQLRRRGIDTIVLCGISTTHGVESTARFAYEYGFQQIFAEDAMAAMSLEMHNGTLNFVFKRIGRIRSTEQILQSLTA